MMEGRISRNSNLLLALSSTILTEDLDTLNWHIWGNLIRMVTLSSWRQLGYRDFGKPLVVQSESWCLGVHFWQLLYDFTSQILQHHLIVVVIGLQLEHLFSVKMQLSLVLMIELLMLMILYSKHWRDLLETSHLVEWHSSVHGKQELTLWN